MSSAAAGGFNLGYESNAHASNDKAGEIIASNAIADLVQRVVVNGEPVDAALGDCAAAIEAIMKLTTHRAAGHSRPAARPKDSHAPDPPDRSRAPVLAAGPRC
jgi:hypothetical protein